jgi:MFS transporter, FHS family, glucose/mannose:H+ symporter
MRRARAYAPDNTITIYDYEDKDMPKIAQNILFCLLITLLGTLFSSLAASAGYMAAAFGQHATSIGVYLSVFAAGSFVSVPLGSVLADWLGKRKIIRIAISILTVGMVIIALSDRQGFLYAGLFLMGVGFGPTESMSSAFLADENPDNPTRWMNISQIGFGVGAVAAPVAAASYLRQPGATYGNVFAVCAFICMLFFTVLSITGHKKVQVGTGARLELNLFSVLKSRELAIYALMIFCYLGFESIAPAYLKLFFVAAGAGDSDSSLMISLFWAAMILCRFFFSFLGGKELRSIKALCLVVITGIAVLLFTGVRYLQVTGVFMIGFGCGSIWPMLVARAAKVYPERSGAACGMMMLFSTAGGTLFPVVIGVWIGNLRITFMLCAALAACVAGGAFLAGHAVQGKQNTPHVR